jgi:cellulose synthase/poly-beta-1,6-N-acetylglucosamine synthase-like glycosyltransferase
MGPGSVYFGINGQLVIQILFAVTGMLLLVYAFLIYYYHRIWNRIPVSSDSVNRIPAGISDPHLNITYNEAGLNLQRNQFQSPLKVSVIIPARNEEDRIEDCLNSLFNQSYPKAYIEIIVVNDFSTDNTVSLVEKYLDRCILLHMADYLTDSINAYKKKAIEIAIAHSSGALILCTDADCSMGTEWVSLMVSAHIQRDLVFIAAPVKIIPDGSAISVFQALDFIALQGITGAAVHNNLYPMCNGANLAYTRNAFLQVGGFTEIDHIASGDDMLLMKKIQSAFPRQTGFIKDTRAIVNTVPVKTIRSFFNQRIRWASKISHYNHPATFLTLALVYLLNAALLLLFFSCIFFGYWQWLLLLIVCKTLSEYFFVSEVAAFFGQQNLMKYFAICQPFHIVYTVFAGSFGSFGNYEWKNRKVK